MGLNAALVDRARRLYEAPNPVKVEGSTQFINVHSPWFRCRLTLPSATYTEASSRVRAGLADSGAISRAVERPYVMFGIRDEEGNSLIGDDGRPTVSGQDRLEITSPQLGTFVYEIVEDPVPIRKKRRVIGFTVGVSRVAEHQYEDRENFAPVAAPPVP